MVIKSTNKTLEIDSTFNTYKWLVFNHPTQIISSREESFELTLNGKTDCSSFEEREEYFS